MIDSQKGRLLRLLKDGVHVDKDIAQENGINNLRQHIHFLRFNNRYRYNIITDRRGKGELTKYYWIDNDRK